MVVCLALRSSSNPPVSLLLLIATDAFESLSLFQISASKLSNNEVRPDLAES